jgi:hypothetical protein
LQELQGLEEVPLTEFDLNWSAHERVHHLEDLHHGVGELKQYVRVEVVVEEGNNLTEEELEPVYSLLLRDLTLCH